MKKLLVGALFSLVALGVYAQEAVVIGGAEMPPIFGEKLPGYGACGEIISAAFKASGLEVVFRFPPIPRLEIQAAEGTLFAALIDPGAITPEYKDKLEVGKAITSSSIVLFYKKASFPNGVVFSDLSELKGRSVGVVRGWAEMEKQLKGKGLVVDLGVDPPQVFNKLVLGRTEFAVSGDLIGMSVLQGAGQKLDDYAYTKAIIFGTMPITFSKAYPDSAKLQVGFTAGMKTIVANYTLKKILEKYYGTGKVPAAVLASYNKW